jgi:hypothetical protein
MFRKDTEEDNIVSKACGSRLLGVARATCYSEGNVFNGEVIRMHSDCTRHKQKDPNSQELTRTTSAYIAQLNGKIFIKIRGSKTAPL